MKYAATSNSSTLGLDSSNGSEAAATLSSTIRLLGEGAVSMALAGRWGLRLCNPAADVRRLPGALLWPALEGASPAKIAASAAVTLPVAAASNSVGPETPASALEDAPAAAARKRP